MKNKCKISFFLQDLSGGGAEKMMVQLANRFNQLGVEVEMVLVRSEGPYFDLLDNGIKIINFNKSRTYKSFLSYFRYLKKNEPDGVLTTLPHLNVLSIIVNIIALNKTKIVVREASPLFNYTKSNYLLIKLSAYSTCIFYHFAYKCVAISDGLKKEIKNRIKFNTEKVNRIYNPVLTNALIHKINSFIKSNIEFKITKFDFKKSDKINYIMAAGRLEDVKDFKTLINAFSRIREDINSKLIIAGVGSQLNNLKSLVSSKGLNNDVIFLGFVDNLTDYLLQSDLFILSSKYEGFGNVLVEALACNLPIVSTDCPYGPSEILEDGKYGALVPVGDYEAMARESINILIGEKKFTGLKERAMDFHVDKIADEYLKVILDE